MPATPGPDQFGTLPLAGQALIAVRMVRRGALGMLTNLDPERDLILKTCEAMESCAFEGQGGHRLKPLFKQAMALRDEGGPYSAEREALRHALWWAVDAILAAEMAPAPPVEETVERSARASIQRLGSDRRVNRLQLTVLVAGDLDLIRHACREAGVGRYDALGAYVKERLTPVHAIDLNEVRPTPEDEAR